MIETKEKTERGFYYGKFLDVYGEKCSIQESSSAEEPRIWFGIDKPKATILAKDAEEAGIDANGKTGWIEVPLPEKSFLSGRMHLNQKNVKELLPILQYFVENGRLP